MSITIIPRSANAQISGTAVGKLATTLLSVAVAGMAEPSRFRRGRAYVADRAVTRLDVSPGLLRATVTGSRHEPYIVEVRVPLIPRPADLVNEPAREHIVRLVPEADDLDVSCTCPDDELPCKHVVAAVLCFAGELGDRPELLVEWSCTSGPAPERAVVGSRARAERHLRLVAPPPPPSPYLTDEWRHFEGAEIGPPPTWTDLLGDRPPVTIGAFVLDRIDLGRVVASAVDALRAP
jgi:SWIM zinc finger